MELGWTSGDKQERRLRETAAGMVASLLLCTRNGGGDGRHRELWGLDSSVSVSVTGGRVCFPCH